MLGDLNNGPAVDGITGVTKAIFEENYEKASQAGFTSANFNSEQPFCTFCADENFIYTTEQPDELIDHVFVRNAETSEPMRFLDEPVFIPLPDGTSLPVNYSDHFGSKAKAVWRP